MPCHTYQIRSYLALLEALATCTAPSTSASYYSPIWIRLKSVSQSLDGAIAMSATALNSVRVDAWGGIGRKLAKARPLTAVEVDIF